MPTPKRPLVLALFSALAIMSHAGAALAAGDTLSLGARAGDQGSYNPTSWSAMSADGRYVTLGAAQSYLTRIYLYDRFSATTTNLMPNANGVATAAEMSADGRFVAFRSSATNLGPVDDNGALSDIYLLDRASGQFSLVSQSSDGIIGNDQSHYTAVSDDGRFVAFSSSASNLVDDDTNAYADAFLRDMKTGKTTRVSVSSAGEQGDAGGVSGVDATVAISGNGRYVVFASLSSNLSGDTDDNSVDVFVKDTVTGITTMVSKHVRTGGATVSSNSRHGSISADGRYIAFQSGSSQLMVDDTDDFNNDIFVYDRVSGAMSKITAGANGHSVLPRISRDGRYVAFASQASNLVPDDTNGTWDTFLYDRKTGAYTRVNLSADGAQSIGDANYGGSRPSLSSDGRFVGFESAAQDLTADDTDVMNDVFLRDTRLVKKVKANVGIAMTAPATAQKGVAFAYKLVVNNVGPGTAKQAEVVVTVPTSLSVIAGNPSQGSCQTGPITVCRLGDIAANGQADITLQVKPLKTGKVTVAAAAEAISLDSKMTNNSVKKTVSVGR